MPKIARPWSAVVTTRRARAASLWRSANVDQLFQVDLAVAIPVDDLRQAGQRRLRGIDRGLFLAFEVAVLVGVGGLEPLLEDAAGLPRPRRAAVFDVDIEPYLPDGELDVAVGEPPDLRPFGRAPPASDPGRRLAGSVGRKGDVERQVDRRPGEEFSQLVQCRAHRRCSCRRAAKASGSIANSLGR